MSLKITVCKKCGQTAEGLLLLALAAAFGASVSPKPHECSEGGKHIFIEREGDKP